MNEILIICDIDGVLANCEHRLEHLQRKEYGAFYGVKMADDIVIEEGRLLLKSLRGSGPVSEAIYYATGRPERTRNLTLNWLEACCIPQAWSERLFMRKDADHRPSPELKVEQVEEILKVRNVISGSSPIDGLKKMATKIIGIFTSETEKLPNIYFIDDDPKNVKAVCDKFPFITGITFDIKRMEEQGKENE